MDVILTGPLFKYCECLSTDFPCFISEIRRIQGHASKVAIGYARRTCVDK